MVTVRQLRRVEAVGVNGALTHQFWVRSGMRIRTVALACVARERLNPA